MNKVQNPGHMLTHRAGGMTLRGYAVSAIASYVMPEGMGCCFDLGHCHMETVPMGRVFLSHVHADHASGLPLHLSLRAMQKLAPPKVYVPAESRSGLVAFLDAFDTMQGHTPSDRGNVIGVSPGDTVPMTGGRKALVFGATHRVPSVGYTIREARKKLLPEYEGLPGDRIRDLNLSGTTVFQVVERDVFTYVGDSTIDTLRMHPEVGASAVLMIEATHLPGVDQSVSAERGHTHLEELAALYEADPTGALAAPHIVLKHFSMRYDRDMVQKAVDQTFPPALRDRVSIFL